MSSWSLTGSSPICIALATTRVGARSSLGADSGPAARFSRSSASGPTTRKRHGLVRLWFGAQRASSNSSSSVSRSSGSGVYALWVRRVRMASSACIPFDATARLPARDPTPFRRTRPGLRARAEHPSMPSVVAQQERRRDPRRRAAVDIALSLAELNAGLGDYDRALEHLSAADQLTGGVLGGRFASQRDSWLEQASPSRVSRDSRPH